MLIGYMRVSKSDGTQLVDLQRDGLISAGVDPLCIYEDMMSGAKEDRPGLASCLKALREGDTLVVWKLDRLGRDLRHLVNTVHDLADRGVGFRVLSGQGASIDTTTPAGRLVFGIFGALAEFERSLIAERTRAGLMAARVRGRVGGRPFKMTAAKLQIARTALRENQTSVSSLCRELGITRQTLYRHLAPGGALREQGIRLLKRLGASSRKPRRRAPSNRKEP